TKSLGRALLLLGYGTAFADELDEWERVVYAPTERKEGSEKKSAPTRPQQQQNTAPAQPQTRTAPAPQPQETPQTTMSSEEYVKSFIERFGIGKLAMSSFVSREKLTKEWDVLAAALRNPEKAAHCCVTSWTMAHKFTIDQIVDLMRREKMTNYQQVWAAIQKDDRDIMAGLTA